MLYGGLGWIQALLWETGVQDIPAAVGAKAARWKLIFWEPFWLLGGLLFGLAAFQFRRRRLPVEAERPLSGSASATMTDVADRR